jgi:hypothetical protein
VTSKKFSINLANNANRCSPSLQTGKCPTIELAWAKLPPRNTELNGRRFKKDSCFASRPMVG